MRKSSDRATAENSGTDHRLYCLSCPAKLWSVMPRERQGRKTVKMDLGWLAHLGNCREVSRHLKNRRQDRRRYQGRPLRWHRSDWNVELMRLARRILRQQ